MNQSLFEAKEELLRFWAWAGTDIKSYIQCGMINGCEECDYLELGALTEKAEILIDEMVKGIDRSAETIETILEIMAIDNEVENILTYCADTLDTDCLKLVYEAGISCNINEAKWQVAELIGRRGNVSDIKYLEALYNSGGDYVKKRALLSIRRLKGDISLV